MIGQRSDFGKDWAEIVNDWCLGMPLPVPSESAWEALGSVEQLWPERLGDVLTRGQKGNFVMAHLVDDGLTLAACENLDGFEGVLRRIKIGEQAALSEMRFAAALVHLGYEPVLDTEHRGKRPDALIIADNKEIFIDVITPEMSEDAKQAGVIASTLAQKLLEKQVNQTTSSRLEVYILSPDLHHLADEIAHFLDIPGLSLSETIHTIPDIALVKYSEQDAFHNVGPTIFVDTQVPVIAVARAMFKDSKVNSVTVRLPFTDDRLELLMGHKREQFSKSEINLWVIDVQGVPGLKRWLPLAHRRLQPTLNRRFSGIVLYHRYLDITTGAFIRSCQIVEHPSPYQKLPASLLNDLGKLHQAPLTDNR